jgi:hypothetical protein
MPLTKLTSFRLLRTGIVVLEQEQHLQIRRTTFTNHQNLSCFRTLCDVLHTSATVTFTEFPLRLTMYVSQRKSNGSHNVLHGCSASEDYEIPICCQLVILFTNVPLNLKNGKIHFKRLILDNMKVFFMYILSGPIFIFLESSP